MSVDKVCRASGIISLNYLTLKIGVLYFLNARYGN